MRLIMGKQRRRILLLCVFVLSGLFLWHLCRHQVCNDESIVPSLLQNLTNGGSAMDRAHPLIFIGGMPRSGTTLMRAMLDAHPAVRCGEETRIVPRMLAMHSRWKKSEKESVRLKEAGVSDQVLDSAVAAFVLEVITRHGEPADRLCNKDPFTLKSALYLHQLFPRARFIFMVRDARATVHSIISRKVTITNFDLSSYRQCLQRWNTAVQTMHQQCHALGSSVCLRVPYEQLVLQPRRWLRLVSSFLRLPWHPAMLHHENTINKPGGVSLSKVERSSDQVSKPVNRDALHKWVGHIPENVASDLPILAPMMKVFGYDPTDPAPTYGATEVPGNGST